MLFNNCSNSNYNIPEGIAVAVRYITQQEVRKRPFGFHLHQVGRTYGALIAYLFLMPFWSPTLNAYVLSAVSGIMVYISLDELLPSAEKYGKHHLSIIGLVMGMAIMALSLYLFI